MKNLNAWKIIKGFCPKCHSLMINFNTKYMICNKCLFYIDSKELLSKKDLKYYKNLKELLK